MDKPREVLQKEAYSLKSASSSATWSSIGETLEVSPKVAKKLVQEYTASSLSIMTPTGAPVIAGNDIELARFQPLHVYGNAVLSCDWHVPLHDPHMVNKLLELAYTKGLKQLIIAGDFFNMDSVSQYLPHQPEANIVRERNDGREIFEAIFEVFDRVVLSMGNHDFRIAKFWGHTLDFEYLMKWLLEGMDPVKLSKLEVSYLDHLIYHPTADDKDNIYVCHPENFSSSPLTIARALVPKFNMGVLTAHSHHFAQGIAADGQHLVFDGGGLFSLNKTEYIRRTNRHHRWTPGFHVFEDGIAQAYSPVYRNL
jgi:predicted phosphodiesterase